MKYDRTNIDERILTAAGNAFFSSGYQKTSMDDIASAAKVSRRTLYQHFPSKLALFVHIMEQEFLQVEQEHCERAELVDVSSVESIRGFLLAQFESIVENRHFMYQLWNLNAEEFEGSIPEPLLQSIQQISLRIRAKTSELFHRCYLAGTFRIDNADMLNHLLSAINKGVYLHTVKEKNFLIADVEPSALFDMFLQICTTGLFQ